jgi:signal transduction histidine kinase
VVESARPAAEAKSVQLLATFDGDPPRCVGDPGRLQQVVTNLLTNAVKFTPSHGRVEVRVDSVNGFARLVVADTGRGIDLAFLPHVFERFAQEGSGQVQGLGIGLAITHDLVELHGGTVSAESPGRDLGSTFTVMLPRKVAPTAGAPGP